MLGEVDGGARGNTSRQFPQCRRRQPHPQRDQRAAEHLLDLPDGLPALGASQGTHHCPGDPRRWAFTCAATLTTPPFLGRPVLVVA